MKCFRLPPKRGALPFVENPVPNFFFFFLSDVGFRVFSKNGVKERQREDFLERERERGGKEKGSF